MAVLDHLLPAPGSSQRQGRPRTPPRSLVSSPLPRTQRGPQVDCGLVPASPMLGRGGTDAVPFWCDRQAPLGLPVCASRWCPRILCFGAASSVLAREADGFLKPPAASAAPRSARERQQKSWRETQRRGAGRDAPREPACGGFLVRTGQRRPSGRHP